MSNKKRAVVVGYGGMGKWHADELLKSDACELLGVCDIDEAKQKKATENGIKVYKNIDEVVADKAVEIVVLAVPNELHRPMAIKAMENGINVISEKPVALGSDELADMIEASKRTGMLFTVHQNRRWDGDFLRMRELYASGDLGEVFCIESRVQGSRGIPGDWRGKREHGGGMVLDWGVHLIDQMLLIAYDKRVTGVYCRCDHITNSEVDDGFKLDLYFENELTARIEVGTSNFVALPRYYMLGRSGSALIQKFSSDCKVIRCTEWNENNVVPVATAAGLTKTMAPRDAKTTEEYELPRIHADVHEFYRNVCAAIDGEAEQIVKHNELMRVMKLMEAAFESDRIGAPVAFDDNF